MGKNKNEQQKSEQEKIGNEGETENVQEAASAEAAPADTGEITAENPQEQPARNPVPLQSIEAWAAELRIPTWQAAALKQYGKYAGGKAVSRADFEAGIKAAINKPQRG